MEALLKTSPNNSIRNVLTPRHILKISLRIILTLYSMETCSSSLSAKLKLPPPWTESIGRLIIPSNRIKKGQHLSFKETCSASLISKKRSPSSRFILTAWHCFENYSDLSRPINFEIKDIEGNIISRIAYRWSNGGGMHADWAILKLDKEVKRSEVKPIEYLMRDISVGDSISIAGYAKDKISTGNRFDLNYGKCKVTEIATDIRLTDCTAVKGNSGGAVMLKIDQYNFALAGIISEGNERNISSFVPIKIFYPELQKYMSKRINLSEKHKAQPPNSGPN